MRIFAYGHDADATQNFEHHESTSTSDGVRKTACILPCSQPEVRIERPDSYSFGLSDITR